MNIKNKILNAISAHPRLITLGVGLAVTFVIGTALGMLNNDAIASFGGSHSSGGIH